ncbi:MAG: DUF4450 domain-containing protein, partial [Bacteroidota bacterium]
EAGDLPEFALYMPGMGGNIKFGLVGKDSSKWLIHAKNIVARYRAGSMIYEIRDPMLGKGKLVLVVMALYDREGIIIKATFQNTLPVRLCWVYGGASGKKFFRDGDMGPDPEHVFYLKPEYCTDNNFTIDQNKFLLRYGTGVVTDEDPYVNKNLPADTIVRRRPGKEQQLVGVVPTGTAIRIVDAAQQLTPAELLATGKTATPAIAASMPIKNNQSYFFTIVRPGTHELAYDSLHNLFRNADAARTKIAGRIRVQTPDPFINTIGGALGIAADAIWEAPTYLHGSIGWRMRLNGWRGPYVGDVLGWHDRAKLHFRAYAKSQLTSPDSGEVIADTALKLVRQLEKLGTSVFSSGYISRNPDGDFRAHHYDMNLVYIDALLNHFKWTGDLAFVKEMFPVIQRHLAWEKRNFDVDGDGLYDAYAAIWASDALQYSGGSVTHSSAYNYRANKMMAELAGLVGEDPQAYGLEATKILQALNRVLWMPSKGTYAEFQDALGLKKLHTVPGIWTIYHSIDSETPDPFQAYQGLEYIDKHIPRIPLKAKGLPAGYHTISTTNWMPYAWSLNNVALAEVMHTSLAAWQGGQPEQAFVLWKSALIESMYLGGSPGNFQQISTYDAARGEAYRDFADPIAMTARSMVEGLFGILPNLLKNEILVKPGFPAGWKHAALHTPDVEFRFKRVANNDVYTIKQNLSKTGRLVLQLKAVKDQVSSIIVNGKKHAWKNLDSSVGTPMIIIDCGVADRYEVKITWLGKLINTTTITKKIVTGSKHTFDFSAASITKVYDPQQAFSTMKQATHNLSVTFPAKPGFKTAFVQLNQGSLGWWQPLSVELVQPVDIFKVAGDSTKVVKVGVRNNSMNLLAGQLRINEFLIETSIAAGKASTFNIPLQHLQPGTNRVGFSTAGADGMKMVQTILTWRPSLKKDVQQQRVSLDNYFNDKVTQIFRNEYLSPRPVTPTLQLPTQGIGEWTHPMLTAEINDSGFRMQALASNSISLPQGISFQTPGDTNTSNIVFTSQWDNYPHEAKIPLAGKARHAYFLLAGSTNPMQTRMDNGAVLIKYMDGSADTLLLKNPENWWPIEQDYLEDGFAFKTGAPRPVRIHLKSGKIISEWDNSIAAFNGKMIEGGAATVLDLPLSPAKELKELVLQTWANDVVIGLMAVTLLK